MNKIKGSFLTIFFAVTCIFIFSCNTNSGKKNTAGDEKHRLGLKLASGTKYYYTLNNQTQSELEVDGKEVNNSSKTEIGLFYDILKDSAGNFQLKITYDKLHITLKNKDGEEEFDAANGTGSFHPVEKMLGSIRGSLIYITLNPAGEVLQTSGTKEIAEKILASLNIRDEYGRKQVQDQLSKLVGEAFVKNNLEEGFKLLPDTAVSPGDSWSGKTVQSADIKFEALTTYTLVAVTKGIASINAESVLSSAENSASVLGYNVASSLKGKQTGEYKADAETGMLLSSKTKTSIEGTVQMMGREVPVSIKMIKEINAKKM
ncbi:MAG: DUF6263 family protein [Chitinophagaceae bacterium]|nr:DUF6263 family protein [Chitinophagaceae bacterium]